MIKTIIDAMRRVFFKRRICKGKAIEPKTTFHVEVIDDSNIVIVAKNKYGVMKTNIYLWPREIFNISPRL